MQRDRIFDVVKLFVVPTPIGNLEDASFRSIECLKSVDLILAEDTRHTAKLLKHYAVETTLRSFHMHNEHKLIEPLIERMQQGGTLALVSDAGTPAISDPGFLLVRACVDNGIEVECLPGPTAFVPALVVSGLPADRFCFEGFLPARKGRQKRLTGLIDEQRTMIFYEAPHRLLRTLQDMRNVFSSERRACVSRELSKRFEQHHRGSLAELCEEFEKSPARGEIVLIVEGKGRHRAERNERPGSDEC